MFKYFNQWARVKDTRMFSTIYLRSHCNMIAFNNISQQRLVKNTTLIDPLPLSRLLFVKRFERNILRLLCCDASCGILISLSSLIFIYKSEVDTITLSHHGIGIRQQDAESSLFSIAQCLD